MSFNYLNVGRLNASRNNDSNQVRNLSTNVNEDTDSIFIRNGDGETIDSTYGVFAKHPVGNYGTEPTKTAVPNVKVANIDAHPEYEEFETGDTFADFFSMVHDAYGYAYDHDLSANETLQIMYAIITADENAEIFKDFLESDDFKDFENACLVGDKEGLDMAIGLINGATEDLQGITLPDVDIY